MQTWQTVAVNFNLPAGTHTFAMNATFGGWNLNWFRISRVGGGGGVQSKTVAAGALVLDQVVELGERDDRVGPVGVHDQRPIHG